MIEIKDLTVRFGQTEVLHDISCEFPAGQITGLMGRNGSGKTVLLKAVCGLVIPEKGEILVNGRLLTPENAHTFSIGALIETPGFLREYSGLKNLRFLASLTGKNPDIRARAAMEAVGLDWRSRKHVGAYSLGMRQRLGLAQAMLDDPEILILDEPMNGLDHAAIAEFRELLHRLAERGKTIVLASHYQEDLRELCRTIYQMDGGRLHRL